MEFQVALYPLFGDTDFDGEVNVIDLVSLLSNWGMTNDCLDTDLDKDGDIDVDDLLFVLTNWGYSSNQIHYCLQARANDGSIS